jgi:DNA-binding beta-propeller fold protein YncE
MRLKHVAAVLAAVGCAQETPIAPVLPNARPPVVRPVPLFGGTVAVSVDGTLAAVSDPDRDLVQVVDLDRMGVIHTAAFSAGSEPGRAVDDGAGAFAVVLRRAGKVAFVSQQTGVVAATHSVCAEPRGITRDSTSPNGLLVACATGEVFRVSAAGASLLKTLGVEARDIFETNGRLTVTTFRDARLYDERSGEPTWARPPSVPAFHMSATPVSFEAQVAWRTVQRPNGELVMVHQAHRTGEPTPPRPPAAPPVPPAAAYYGGTAPLPPPAPSFPSQGPNCALSVLRTAVTRFTPEGPKTFHVPGVLPIDAAVSPDGKTLVIAHAATNELTRVPLETVPTGPDVNCGPALVPAVDFETTFQLETPVGLAFTPSGELLVHYRVPNVLILQSASGHEVSRISLGAPVQANGHRLFHFSTGPAACASCHPEGHEDGHTWTFGGAVRRTQDLSGGLLATAPFHWKGDLARMQDVMRDTFVTRMGGAMPTDADVDDLGRFLDAIPAPKPFAGTVASETTMGRAAFVKAGCESCHGGAKLGSNATLSVGKREAMQVPSLIGVSRRGPWMSDGCASTLRARFTDVTCGGSTHGDVASLSAVELDALVTYLERL